MGYQQLLNTAQLQNRRECLNNSCSLESQSCVDNASQKASKHEAPVAHFNIMNSAQIYFIPLGYAWNGSDFFSVIELNQVIMSLKSLIITEIKCL